jgi:adenylate cyclase
MEADLARFFGSVRASVLVGRSWSEAGLLDPTDPVALNALFVPLLEQNPHFSSMMVANSEGVEYLLLRDPLDPDTWTNRVVQADTHGTRVFNRRWSSETGALEEWWSELDYDPRRRIWYQQALETRPDAPVAWTRPAIFFVTKDPGITAATHATSPDGGSTTVVAFDLLLMDISRVTTRMPVSENGKAFVLVDDGSEAMRVVGLPRDPRYETDGGLREALLFTPEAVADARPELPPVAGIAQLVPAVRAWQAEGPADATLRYRASDGAWWAGFRAFPLGPNTFWIGIAVPESDFLGEVTRQSQLIAVLAFVALLAASGMAIALARSYSRPLEELARGSRRIGELDLVAAEPIETRLAELDQLAREQERMRATLDSFARYVPVDLVRQLLRRGEAARIGGERRIMTILFTDIEGFTSVSEALEPEALTAHMVEYFRELLDLIRAHHGEVNELMGDGVVAFWGAPTPDPEHSRHAVEAVLDGHRRIGELNARWSEAGRPPLPTRFGLAAGRVVVGNIGSPSRLAYAAVGDAVNLASRIEGLNRFYGTRLLASQTVRDGAGEGFEWRHVDGVRAKGKSQPVELHEPLGPVGDVTPERLAFRDRYEEALGLYRAHRFTDASAVLEGLGDETSVVRLLKLARGHAAAPPGADWDAITDFTVK